MVGKGNRAIQRGPKLNLLKLSLKGKDNVYFGRECN